MNNYYIKMYNKIMKGMDQEKKNSDGEYFTIVKTEDGDIDVVMKTKDLLPWDYHFEASYLPKGSPKKRDYVIKSDGNKIDFHFIEQIYMAFLGIMIR